MSYYLSKYVGTYRVKSDIDMFTNDFPRDPLDRIEQNDVYIACNKGSKIYHYGHGVMVAYVPSLGRGRNILKSIGKSLGLDIESYYLESSKIKQFDYERFYKELEEQEIVFNIEETDSEVLWNFKDKNMNQVAPFLKPLTSGSSISPFSTRNLPKCKYSIPLEEMEEYREITDRVPKEDILLIAKATRSFISEYLPNKYKEYAKVDMNKLMKKKCLKGKEFIHSLGVWSDYIKYLTKLVK